MELKVTKLMPLLLMVIMMMMMIKMVTIMQMMVVMGKAFHLHYCLLCAHLPLERVW
jgi:hypothetical protein